MLEELIRKGGRIDRFIKREINSELRDFRNYMKDELGLNSFERKKYYNNLKNKNKLFVYMKFDIDYVDYKTKIRRENSPFISDIYPNSQYQ